MQDGVKIITTYSTVMGFLCLAPNLFDETLITVAVYGDTNAIAMIFFLGYVGSALGVLWDCQAVIAMVTVGRLSTSIMPLFGVLSAAIFLRETLNETVIGGGVLVLAGLMLVNRPRRAVSGVGAP